MVYETIRKLYADLTDEDYQYAYEVTDQALNLLKAILSKGVKPDSDLLSLYYYTKVLSKKVLTLETDGKYKYMFDKKSQGTIHNSVQILVFNKNREKILLQKRGLFKSLFPQKYTVTANIHGEFKFDAVSKVLNKEIGIEIVPERLQKLSINNSFDTHLRSYEFHAFSNEEKTKLIEVYEEKRYEFNCYDHILIDYNESKKCLSLFSVNKDVSEEDILEIASEIQNKTSIPFTHHVFNISKNSLVTYQLNKKEEEKIIRLINENKAKKEDALKKIQNSMSISDFEQSAKVIDSDDMEFIDWVSVVNDFEENPLKYALDLIGPYLRNKSVWREVKMLHPEIININHSFAKYISVAGGKGSNTHILREMEGLKVPETSVITTFAYKKVVLDDSKIKEMIIKLDELSKVLSNSNTRNEEEIRDLSRKIREKICLLKISSGLKKSITKEFQRLGGIIAVRSSANVEDLKEYAAAGQARSFLNVIDQDEVINSVKKVWASLFEDGFVTTRNLAKFSHSDARMAVLLQRLVENVKSAGVITSVHPSGRPLYNITALAGFGEQLVQGKGGVDTWCVGLLADSILEKWIGNKVTKYIKKDGGGIEEAEVSDPTMPSLEDIKVLELAKTARKIHKFYNKHGLADNIDIEYVVDKKGKIYIVQTRSEKLHKIENQTLSLTMIDKNKIPRNMEYIDLPHDSIIAHPGAITAKLQVAVSVNSVKPEVILVVDHTNNSWNDKFAQLLGIITIDGGSTSHAAKNSRALDIPCLVGVDEAVNLLEEYDGRIVTLDTESKRLYLGEVPIERNERHLNIWIADSGELENNENIQEEHEIFRTWQNNHGKRDGVFTSDCEGHWRRRSSTLKYFQIDYYYKAWDVLNNYLNKKYINRTKHELLIQDREIKNRGKDHRCGLFHLINTDNIELNQNIYNYLHKIPGLDIEDFRDLYEERWKAFREFDSYIEKISQINDENVKDLMDKLITLFSWMHFAFWLNACIDNIFVHKQLKYINPKFHDLFREASILNEPDELKTDLSRLKDKEIYALIEKIRNDEKLWEVFLEEKNVTEITNMLNSLNPDIMQKIESWSMNYKATSERINLLSDTDEYINLIRNRLIEGSSLAIKPVASCMRKWYFKYEIYKHLTDKMMIEAIKNDDEDLYLLLCGLVRSELTGHHSKKKKFCYTEHDLARYLPHIFYKVIKCMNEQHDKEIKFARILENFPNLKQILAVSKLETTLREDGHHHVVKFQRKIAKMMLDVASRHSEIFDNTMQIFDISTEEFIALFKDVQGQSYIRDTFKRWKIIENAEKTFMKNCEQDKMKAFLRFEGDINKAVEILENQKKSAEYDGVKLYYEGEIKRLKKRIIRLNKTLNGTKCDRSNG